MDDVVAVVTDLFFQSRISAAARAASRNVRYVRALSDVQGLDGCALVLVDLDASVDGIDAIRRLRSAVDAPIVAFGPHVDTERRKEARAAGASRVLAKSKFVTELPRLMEREAR